MKEKDSHAFCKERIAERMRWLAFDRSMAPYNIWVAILIGATGGMIFMVALLGITNHLVN